MKTVLLFAGQGAQTPGMGLDFAQAYPSSLAVFQEAERISGLSLTDIIREGRPELNQTQTTQPAVACVSAAIFEALRQHQSFHFEAVLGFSLGEYPALYAANVLSLTQMLETVTLRAGWMEECANAVPGAMAAVLQADPIKLTHLCASITKTDGYVAIANYNSPQQLVVSGRTEGIDALTRRIGESGAKRMIRLNTSGGFHTPLMKEAAIKLRDHLASLSLKEPSVPIIMNASASDYIPGSLPQLAQEQTMGPVRFVESVETLIARGFTRFVEIGPGSVLSGLIKKIHSEVETISIQTVSDLANWEEKR
jgi:[acyl-carrier-protein] S-malonyltransferase